MPKFIASAGNPPPNLTVFTSSTGVLTKTYHLDATAMRTDKAPPLYDGTFRTRSADTVEQLAQIITHLAKTEALCWGVPANGEASGAITTKSSPRAGAITRTKENFVWPARQGWLMLDIDDAGRFPSLEAIRGALLTAVPDLAAVPMLGMSSASAMIYVRNDPVPLRGLTGARFYVAVSQAGDIVALGQAIHHRLFLAGLGRHHITEDGRVLAKSPVDPSVWQPTRLDYAAGANCTGDLEQRRIGPKVWGPDAAALASLPALTPAEQAKVKDIEAAILAAGAPESLSIRAEREAAGKPVAQKWNGSDRTGHLSGDHPIQLVDGSVVPVDEILSNKSGFHGQECLEPLEPEYRGGGARAIIYSNQASPLISSRAHGGTTYFLSDSPEAAFSVVPVAADPSTTGLPPHIVDFNSKYALIRRMASTVLHTPTGEPEFLPIDHWRIITAPDRVEGKPASQLWLAHLARRVFRQVTMDPSSPPYCSIPVSGDVPDFNIWPGFAIQPSPLGSCDLFLDHLRDVVCSRDELLYQWVLQWLAAMVQAPERLAGTALVLRGPQGSGKSYVGEVMGKLLGAPLYSKVSKPEELTGRFNSHHQGKLLLQVEEGFFAGNRAAVGALKHMITSGRVRIEGKFRDSYEIPNYCRMLITSNEEWVIPAGESERRFTVIDMLGARKDDWEYHATLRAQMDNGGYENLLHVLLNTPLDFKLLSRPVNTAALRDQQLASMEADQRWLYDILHAGSLPDGRMEANLLYEHYSRFLRDHSAGRRADRAAMGKLLAQRLGAKRARPRVTEGRLVVYQFPPLAECRAAFSVGLALSPEWDETNSWPTDDALEAII